MGKNLETGKSLDKTWRAGEAYIEAQVDKLECQYSYDDGDDMVFLNMESFEEERVARSVIDKAAETAGGRVEKSAKLETGATINVPIFIDIGEEIKVDTEEGKYLGRVGASVFRNK